MAIEYVTLGTTSGGRGARGTKGEPVEVPLTDLRGARGLVAGAPDAGIEDVPSMLAAQLHTAGQSVLLVDPDGSHAGFARDHDVRSVGDGRDSDLRIAPANADRIVTVAGEGDTSAVLDCDSFGSRDEATEVLGRIADGLARARRDRRSLVVVLAQAHEWLPDAGTSSCLDPLMDLGDHSTPGVGVIAVTDRPGGLESRYRRACDWIAAHRVSWREHVDAVARILGRGYEDDLEALDDGEALLAGPWLDAVDRMRFEEPDERSRPQTTSRTQNARKRPETNRAEQPGSRGTPAPVPDLSGEFAELRDRLDEIETTLAARTDPRDVVDEVADAVVDRLDERGIAPSGSAGETGGTSDTKSGAPASNPSTTTQSKSQRESAGGQPAEPTNAGGGFGDVFDAFEETGGASTTETTVTDRQHTQGDHASTTANEGNERQPQGTPSNRTDGDSSGMSFEPMNFAFDEGGTGGSTRPEDVERCRSRSATDERRVPRYVRDVVRAVEEMDSTTRKMLAHYVDRGADTPLNAHFSAGGSGDRTAAYAHNRQLRTTGFVEHVGRGHYSPTFPDKIRETADTKLSTEDVSTAVEHVRRALP